MPSTARGDVPGAGQESALMLELTCDAQKCLASVAG